MKSRRLFHPLSLSSVLLTIAIVFVAVIPSAAIAPLKPSDDLSLVTAGVKAYGAVGNGVTDDTAAVLQAVNVAAAQTGGGMVYFPAGVYKLSSSLTIPNTIELVFETGASLSLDTGVSLVINGAIVAGNHTLFSGNGSVSGSPVSTIGNPVWFGAAGNGTTDDTAAFAKALAMFSQVDIPYSANGYVISSLTLNKAGTVLQGTGDGKAKLIAAGLDNNMITIQNSNIHVRNLRFEMAGSGASTCLYLDDSSVGLERVYISHIETHEAYHVVRDADHASNMIITTHFEDFQCLKGRNTAFVMNDMWGFIFLMDSTIDYAGSSVTQTFPAVTVKDNAGLIVNNVDIVGKTGGTQNAQGFFLTNSVAVWIENVAATNLSGAGYAFSGGSIDHIYIMDCTAANCYRGYDITGGNYVQLVRSTATGCTNYGMYLTGNEFQLSDNTISQSGSHGLYSTASYSTFTNTVCNANAGYGVYSTGSRCSFVGVSGSGNTSGLTRITGTGSGHTSYTPTENTATVPASTTMINHATNMQVGSNIVVSAYENAFSLTSSASVANIAIPVSYEVWSTRPYLVLNADASSTANMHFWLSWNNVQWFEDQPFSSVAPVQYAGQTIVNLMTETAYHPGETLWIYIYAISDSGATINLRDLYFSSVYPAS